jgi:hypothetical protein
LILPAEGRFHLETAAKPLKLVERVLSDFSKCALKSLDDQTDFDSAMRRFESSRPSQAVGLLIANSVNFPVACEPTVIVAD